MVSPLTKPTVIFVPGAWHSPDVFREVSNFLEAAGHKTKGVSMASVGRKPAIKSFDPDVEFVRTAVQETLDEGDDVVLVMHSYGGMPGSEALKGLSKAARATEGKGNGVAHLVHMCSFIAVEGRNMIDNMGGDYAPWIVVKDDEAHATRSPEIFYNDCDSATASLWTERLSPHAVGSFHSRATHAAWREIPNTYIVCEDDKAIPLFAQEAMLKEAKEAGGDFNEVRLPASHSPFLSMPKEIADTIREAAR